MCIRKRTKRAELLDLLDPNGAIQLSNLRLQVPQLAHQQMAGEADWLRSILLLSPPIHMIVNLLGALFHLHPVLPAPDRSSR